MSDVESHDDDRESLYEIAHEELAVHLDSLDDAMAFFKSRNNRSTQDSDAGRVLEHVAMRAVYFRQLGMIDDELATRLIDAVNKNQLYLHTEYESASARQHVYKRAQFEELDYSVLDPATSASDVSQAKSSMGAAPTKEVAATGVQQAFVGIDHRHIFRDPPRRQTRAKLTQEHMNALGLFLYHSEIAPNIVMAVLTALTVSTFGVTPALVAKGTAMAAAALLPGRRQAQPDEDAAERFRRRRRTAVAGSVGVFGQAAAGAVGETLRLRNMAQTQGWLTQIAVALGVEDPAAFSQMPLLVFDGQIGQLAHNVLSWGNQVVFDLTNFVADNSGWITIGSIVVSLAYYFVAFHERMYLPERMNHFLRLNDRTDGKKWKNELVLRLSAITTPWKRPEANRLKSRAKLLYDSRVLATQQADTLEREVAIVSDFIRDMRSLKLQIEQLRTNATIDPHPPGFRASVVDEVFERMQTMRLQ